jgi:hypothetical protein
MLQLLLPLPPLPLQAGIQVSGIMGTSAGALAGSLYAAGYTPREVRPPAAAVTMQPAGAPAAECICILPSGQLKPPGPLLLKPLTPARNARPAPSLSARRPTTPLHTPSSPHPSAPPPRSRTTCAPPRPSSC